MRARRRRTIACLRDPGNALDQWYDNMQNWYDKLRHGLRERWQQRGGVGAVPRVVDVDPATRRSGEVGAVRRRRSVDQILMDCGYAWPSLSNVCC